MPDEACNENKLSPIEEKHSDLIESVIGESDYEYLVSPDGKAWFTRGDYWIKSKEDRVLRVTAYGDHIRVTSTIFMKRWVDEGYDEVKLYKALQNALYPSLALRKDGTIEYACKVPVVSEEILGVVLLASIEDAFEITKKAIELRKNYDELFN